MSDDPNRPEEVYRSKGDVHWDRDCHHLANVDDDDIRERSPSVWPDWIDRCDDCVGVEEPIYHERDWLVRHYWVFRETADTMGDDVGVSSTTIRKWLRRNDIPVRENGTKVFDPRLADPEWLREKYWDEELTTWEIADICDVSQQTVCDRMDGLDIERRSLSEITKKVFDPRLDDPEWLREKYWDEELTTYEIADICDVGQKTVCERMDKLGIEKRSLSEILRRRHESDRVEA